MKCRSALSLSLLLVMIASPAPARAHHGAAAYDLANATTLEATVAQFVWANPHALVTFTVASPDGTIEEWTAETAGPVILVRAGWTKNTLKARDEITIVGHRARNGSRTMLLQRVVLADGREFTSFIPR